MVSIIASQVTGKKVLFKVSS